LLHFGPPAQNAGGLLFESGQTKLRAGEGGGFGVRFVRLNLIAMRYCSGVFRVSFHNRIVRNKLRQTFSDRVVLTHFSVPAYTSAGKILNRTESVRKRTSTSPLNVSSVLLHDANPPLSILSRAE